MTRPLTTVPSRLLATPSDSSRSAAKRSFAGASLVCTSRAIPSPRSRAKRKATPSGSRRRARPRYHRAQPMSPALRPNGVSAPSTPDSQCARDKAGDALEDGVRVERCRIDNRSIGRRDQRGGPTLDIARVAFLQILQDIFQYSCGALLSQLREPTPGALFGAGSDKQLYHGGWTDDRADVAAVKDRSLGWLWGVGREIPLQVEQRTADAGKRGDHRSRRRDRFAPQAWVREQPRMDKAGSPCRSNRIRRVARLFEHEKRRRAIKCSGVEVGEAEMLGEAARKGALAGGSGSIDRNDKGRSRHACCFIVPPSPFIRGRKSGKLVAIGVASSMRTGSLAASPKTRKAIAMRWSSWVSMVAPPAGKLPAPSTSKSSPSTATRTPHFAKPAAIPASRSLSLTRSSARPRITVRPLAQAAATASIGYSSIIRGARSAGISAPFNGPARARKSATGSPPSSRSF